MLKNIILINLLFLKKGETKMEKRVQRQIEYNLKNYQKLIKSTVQSTADFATKNMSVDYGKVAVQTSPSNFREELLCRMIDKSSECLRWVGVIDKVIDHYKFEDKKQIILLRYFNGYSVSKICKTIGISTRTYFNWRIEIIELTEGWARELVLIK